MIDLSELEGIIKPKKDFLEKKILNKHKYSFIENCFLNNKFTKLESNLLTLLLHTIQKNSDENEYVFNFKSLMSVLGINTEHYRTLIKAINGLSEKVTTINNDGYIEKTKVITKIKYPSKDNIYINDDVIIELSNRFKEEYLKNDKSLTLEEVKHLLSFSSIHTKKIYLLLSQNGNNIKLSKDQIQEILGTNYKDFSVLMTKHIKPAIEEIREKTDMVNLRLIEIKDKNNIIGYEIIR